jgi:Domain of unknown function (DUF4157)
MNSSARGIVIQGSFPTGIPVQLTQHGKPQVPNNPASSARRPLTYQELTIQAHMRSAGGAVQASGSSGNAFMVPPHLASLNRRSGQKLPTAVQQKMESFFGADFSDVQVHVGPEASAIGALAFTQGTSIYFAPGQYNPSSHFGQQLLGHELTHVMQQRAGRVRNPYSSGIAVVQDPALEAEAERMGTKAAWHQPVGPVPVQAKMHAGTGTPAKVTQARMALSPSYWPGTSIFQRHGSFAASPLVDHSTELLQPRARNLLSSFLSTWDIPVLPRKKGTPGIKRTPGMIGNKRKRSKREPTPAKKKQKQAVVTLKIGSDVVSGTSSTQYGHAEMAALRKFIMEKCDGDVGTAATRLRSRAKKKTVSCHNQPVCGSCTRVLQALGFTVADTKTLFSDVKSGGVSWGANMKVAELMEYMGLKATYDAAVLAGKK